MTTLPEVIARRWVAIQPLMENGALLREDPRDNLYYVDRAWPGLDWFDVKALARLGLIRQIGAAYVVGTRPDDPLTPLSGTYPAITVWQPWATLIAEQAKPWELRSMKPPAAYVGRRVAIHAAGRKLQLREIRALLARLSTRRAASTGLDPEIAVPVLEWMLQRPDEVIRGSMVCTGILGAPLPIGELEAQLGIDTESRPGEMARAASWAWPLIRVEPLPYSEPVRGYQGWWKWQVR